MRRAAKIDENQPEIVKTYRRLGCSVSFTHQVGGGFPDIAVGKYGLTDLVEIKDGDKPESRRKLTDDEARWHSKWRGSKRIIESVDDVFLHIEEMRKRASWITNGKLGAAMRGEVEP